VSHFTAVNTHLCNSINAEFWLDLQANQCEWLRDSIQPKHRELYMSLRKSVLAAAAVVSLVAVPTVAAAQTAAASKLSVRAAPATQKAVRSTAARGERSEMGGSIVIALLAAAAAIAAIVVAADGSNAPSSP
jgi:hypothetical protein